MNSPWIRAQDRKRNLVAAASTVCIYALAIAGAWAVGMLMPASLASVPSNIIVDLGGTEGQPGEVPLGLANAPDRPPDAAPGAAPAPASVTGQAAFNAPEPPAAAATATPTTTSAIPVPPPTSVKAPPKTPAKAAPLVPPKAPAKATTKSIPASSPKAIAEKAAADKAAEAAAAEAQAQAAQSDAALRAAAATAQASVGPPKTRTFGSSSAKAGSDGAPVASTGTGAAPGVSGGTGTVTYRGSEMGSALTTTFGASSGQVGRNLYVPIYLYMPLPSTVSGAIYRNIQAKETFQSIYHASGSDWVLSSQVPLAQRGQIWSMLETAGYDASNADYKTGRKLQPVVLEFAVGPLAKNKVELVDVRLVSSSGSSEIDEAVIYGFRQASFFNKTGYAVGGKFVYGF